MNKASLAAIAMMMAPPIWAQDDAAGAPDEKINQLIVYGNDECPESKGEEIVVCARMAEKERYRIPTTLRDDPNDRSKEAWTNRVIAYESVGASGTMSCSPSGAGGFTGCGLGEINTAYAEKKSDPGINFGRLIAAERKKRLAGIDAESNEVEERVKQFEKERAEKEARQSGLVEIDSAASEGGALPEPK